jgi:periplasmic protein TonB
MVWLLALYRKCLIMKNSSGLTFDDIIFEGRNKAYGAYELRQLTDRHNAYGLFIAASLFIVLVFLAGVLSHNSTMPEIIKTPVDIRLSIIDPISPPPPKLQETVSPPAVNTKAFTEFNPVVDPIVTPAEVPTQEQLLGQIISTTTVTTTTPGPAVVEPIPATTNITSMEPINTNTVKNWAEVMPSFVGGEKALREYLATHIKMRPIDIENGINGKLYVRFYVDTDGSVKDAVVLQDGAGGHCAEVALSVISKMPKWNPGMQNNKPVKVYYTVPIKFEVK